MAGAGPLADELRGQSPPNVRWAGYVDGEAKQRLKAGCRAILFPSLWPEPLSTVAYEASEAKKPIVTSNLGGMPEVVVHGETGLLLDPGNPEAWRRTILELARDPGLSLRLGAKGREWLDREVSPTRWAEQFNVIARQSGVSQEIVPCAE